MIRFDKKLYTVCEEYYNFFISCEQCQYNVCRVMEEFSVVKRCYYYSYYVHVREDKVIGFKGEFSTIQLRVL